MPVVGKEMSIVFTDQSRQFILTIVCSSRYRMRRHARSYSCSEERERSKDIYNPLKHRMRETTVTPEN